ncbi:putative membrane-bound dehydrogenase-like protein [Runella defluvii]|uniref:Putative membrane-bound dehydrogenase-like protein n=1 Tax=Runella defluvii TaxID=370973 RepID=A0A7W5ZMV4_9BACT|nr:PVC-type heme-binding CxxCH protein [Runella defluvii]MBB3839811.1 putative membrane-bound dehydrogenase-like protein [Runella defluvii]
MKKYLWGLGALAMTSGLVASYQNDNPSRASQSSLDSVYAKLTQEQKHDLKYAVGALEVADGLEANLFASEPMITNPTNIDIDHRGRVWVLEAYNYRPAITGNPTHSEGDRILILEDTNGDGKADLSKVFYQGPEVAAPLGVLVMGNRVLVSQSPYVWLFTDENGDDKADKKEIIFQGIKGEQHDHGMHAFTFGPDGKLYFNFGNEGNQLLDGKGQPVLDQDGQPIDRKKYKQGMVFRCDPDFKNVEVLGHNFRNNYEVAVDSYGTMWQSDNDDDGNKGVRINYVMEYGNYGYTDEMTGAGWSANRTNIEAEIPFRHWHLNDPGVVPNLLQTGAGSPTGMVIYEGDMLPTVFQNQMIHCDAGPNVVRSYPVEKNGAGYKANMVNVLYGKRNQWFRPSDVCVAPDGSLFAADWYDPGVGGHQAGDLNRGRIYRITPPNTSYKTPAHDFTTLEGALKAIQSPNVSVRYLAWNKIRSLGQSAESELSKMYQTSPNPRMKARALWLLSKLPNGHNYVSAALKDANADLRITAIRAARQITAKGVLPLTVEQLNLLASDSEPQVRREVALAIRHNSDDLAADIWAQLANRYDGQDRWYLEALGVSADGQWDKFFGTWLKLAGPNPTASAKGKDLVWRARTAASVPLLASLAGDKNVALKDRLRYFRAFDFNPGATEKSTALLELMKTNTDTEITKLCLRHLDPGFVKTSPLAQQNLQKLLDASYGTGEYMDLVQRFEPASEAKRLLQLALDKPMQREGRDAARQLLKQEQTPLLWATINGKDVAKAQNTLIALRGIGSKQSLDILKSVALDPKRPKAIRTEATRALGGSMDGEDLVLDLLQQGKIANDYKAVAVQGVSGAWRKNVKIQAAKYLDAAPTKTGKKLPPVSELMTLTGNVANGKTVFANYCAICHQVNGEGSDFGPKLSEIGSKLGKDGQYMAIFYPSAGVSFGYEGYEVKFKDGSTTVGIVASKTETDLLLKFPGGTTQSYKMSQVVSMKKLDESLMTAGLHESMSQQELVDLIEYLSSLKRK